MKVVIVGGEFDLKANYPNNFTNFRNELHQKVINKNKTTIEFKRVVGDNWHGKVAVKLFEDDFNPENNIYYGTIIGSSNSNPINILNDQFGWNKEADLYIVNGDLVTNSNLNQIKEAASNLKICKNEIANNINRINWSIKTINIKEIYDVGNIVVVDNEELQCKLNSLRATCKDYFSGVVKNDERYLFDSILKSISEINNLKRIENEINKSINNIEKPWNSFKKITGRLISKAKVNNEIVAEKFEKVIKDIEKLLEDEKNFSYDTVNSIYAELKKLKNEYENKEIWENTVLSDKYKEELSSFKEELKIIRKNLLVFKTSYDLKLDGAYLESIIKGIYIEIADIIYNFTIE